MKNYVFIVCLASGFSRSVRIENVEDCNCALDKLGEYMHKWEYILDLNEL